MMKWNDSILNRSQPILPYQLPIIRTKRAHYNAQYKRFNNSTQHRPPSPFFKTVSSQKCDDLHICVGASKRTIATPHERARHWSTFLVKAAVFVCGIHNFHHFFCLYLSGVLRASDCIHKETLITMMWMGSPLGGNQVHCPFGLQFTHNCTLHWYTMYRIISI